MSASPGPASSFGNRRGLALAPLLLLASALVFALAASSARAAAPFVFTNQFDVGQSTGFLHGNGVAVDNSTNPLDPSAGDVYVVNGGVVNKFTPAAAAAGENTPVAQLSGLSTAWGVAVDPADGDVYVTDLLGGVHKYDASGNPIAFALDPSVGLSLPTGIAVSPVNGDLYVGNFNANTVYRFDSSGTSSGDTYIAPGPAAGIAVDPAGAVYAATASGTVKFTAPGTTFQTIDPGPSYAVATDPAGEVFVHDGSYATAYDSSGAELGSPFGQGKFNSTRGGIGVDAAAETVYVADNGADAANVFLTSALFPEIGNGSAPVIFGGNATVSGIVSPANTGGDVTSCHFEYGVDTTYGATVPCSAAPPYSGPTSVDADLTDLKLKTTYHYRIAAANSRGTVTGDDQTFETEFPQLPVVVSTSSAEVTQTSAALAAQINPGGGPTIYAFQWGTDSGYGSRTLWSKSIGSDGSLHTAGAVIAAGTPRDCGQSPCPRDGLTPGTTYHFRVIATNLSGNAYGPDQTFTTQSAPSSAIAPSAPPLGAPASSPAIKPHPASCKRGYVRKHGRCARKHTSNQGHHKHGKRGSQ